MMKMRQAFRIAGRIFAAAAGIVLLAGAGLFANHQIRLCAEKPLTQPLGQIADVDGQQISVYTEGTGTHTLVFLQGGGLPCPILEMKSLYTRLSDQYRIAVVERPGYGFSAEADDLIPLEQELELERAALAQLGIPAPYVLVPHSASGIEAMLWAGTYPDEVEAIVGLDMSVPEYYRRLYDLDAMRQYRAGNRFPAHLQSALMRALGVVRFYDIDALLDSFRTGDLTDADKAVYRAVAYKIFFNRTMSEGILTLPDDMEAVEAVPMPALPMLLFISDGTELGLESPDMWIAMQTDFAAAHGAETVRLACGHSMQNIEQARIAADMNAFLHRLDNNGEDVQG